MAHPEKVALGELLKAQGLLSDEQLQQALAEQGRSGRKLARVIVEAGYASEETIARALAQKLNASYVDLRSFNPAPELVALLPESTARRYRAMVLDRKGERLVVGFADPTDPLARDEIARLLRKEIALAVVTESALLLAMTRIYPKVMTTAAAEPGTALAAEDELAAERFDIHVSLPTPLDKETLTRRLTEQVGIEADLLDAVVASLMAGRPAKIRSEVSRQVADKIADDCRRAGFAVDARECLRLVDMAEKAATPQHIPCPNCGALVVPEETPECPSCGLLLVANEEETESQRKKRYEEEERARVERQNELTRKSNEQLLREQEEQKLRDDARAQLELKKVEDLRRQQDAELRKKMQTRRTIQWVAGTVILLSLAFVAGRWFALKAVTPQAPAVVAAQQGAPAAGAATPTVRALYQAGRVELMEGEVQVLDRDKKPRAVKVGDMVQEGDSIVTGNNGEIHLRMRDEGFIAVRPNTDLQVVEYRAQGDERDKGLIALAKGSFRSVTGWIGKFNTSAYQVKTPGTTIGIRGTDHEPLVIPAGSSEGEAGTYDRVYVGASYIETAKGRVDVAAGQIGFAAAAPGGESALPRLVAQAPVAYRPTRNENLIKPRHEAIQKTLDQQRDERRRQVEQVCRKD